MRYRPLTRSTYGRSTFVWSCGKEGNLNSFACESNSARFIRSGSPLVLLRCQLSPPAPVGEYGCLTGFPPGSIPLGLCLPVYDSHLQPTNVSEPHGVPTIKRDSQLRTVSGGIPWPACRDLGVKVLVPEKARNLALDGTQRPLLWASFTHYDDGGRAADPNP